MITVRTVINSADIRLWPNTFKHVRAYTTGTRNTRTTHTNIDIEIHTHLYTLTHTHAHIHKHTCTHTPAFRCCRASVAFFRASFARTRTSELPPAGVVVVVAEPVVSGFVAVAASVAAPAPRKAAPASVLAASAPVLNPAAAPAAAPVSASAAAPAPRKAAPASVLAAPAPVLKPAATPAAAPKWQLQLVHQTSSTRTKGVAAAAR